MFSEEKQSHIYYITHLNPQCFISSLNSYKIQFLMEILYDIYLQ